MTPLDWIRFGVPAVVGAIVGAAIAYQVGHWKGFAAGAASERSAALQRSLDLIKERIATDAEVSRMDDAALCRALGGRWVQPDNVCE